MELVDAKSILTRTSGYLAGFTHSLQPYAGCQFSCVYCYVRESAVQRTNRFGLPWSRWLLAKRNAAELLAASKSPGDGAVVVFDGIVRNNSKGRATLYLDYEAYEPMALRKMREIAAEMRARFAVDRIALVHRLGRLQIGETSVLIVVSAGHRGAAFDACRFAIETLKRTVPIWKKEYFADGEVWVEGATAEPVPHAANKPFSTRDES